MTLTDWLLIVVAIIVAQFMRAFLMAMIVIPINRIKNPGSWHQSFWAEIWGCIKAVW